MNRIKTRLIARTRTLLEYDGRLARIDTNIAFVDSKRVTLLTVTTNYCTDY
jgi:hypothetical protein